MYSKHLANKHGKARRTSRVIMTYEGRVLRELRIRAELSMKQAGALIGVSGSYISHIENSRSAPPPKGNKLEKFLAAYGGMKEKIFMSACGTFRAKTHEKFNF